MCNEEKHNIEIFSELNQNDNGKERYLFILKLRNIKAEICKELHLKNIYKEKSKKMMGNGNYNFGKTFSEETRKKMSNSIREAKGGVSDEIIIQVRNLIQEKYKNIEIQNLLNLPRHTITRIKNGEIVCKNEKKIDRIPLTREEINLSKRKIQAKEIIIVIEKINKKWSLIKILDYLIKQRNHNNIQNNLTIDIIKNIKRNLTNGNSVIYKSELSEIDYEYYNQLVNIFAKNNIK